MRYYMMDILQLDGATMGRYKTASSLPWNIKPCLGLLSDTLPLFGFHRTPYLVLAGLCGVIAYSILGLVPLAALATVPLFFLVNVSVSAPDVLIDASTAELSKGAPARASDLQSLSWGALSIGGMVACGTKGPLKELLGSKGLFLVLVLCSLSLLVPSLLRVLPERRLPREHYFRPQLVTLTRHSGISALAAFMSALAVSLSVLQVVISDAKIRGAVTLSCGILLAIGLYVVLKRVSPVLARTALFIFLKNCSQPGLGEAMFVWLTKYPGGPRFRPAVLGWIDCFGSVSLLLGVIIYNKYLTTVSYQRIFLMAQLALVLSNVFDYVLVQRWNLAMGIPDVVFMIGDDAFTAVMGRFITMPMMVLASKVCPDNIEATLFAMLMSLANFGGSVSEFFGVTLCEAFGIVNDNFDHLPAAIVTKALTRLLPIPLIFLLVPNLTPSDPVPTEVSKEDASSLGRENGAADIECVNVVANDDRPGDGGHRQMAL